MLKSSAGEKIMQIMKKSAVEFASLSSLSESAPVDVGVQSGHRQPVGGYQQSTVGGCLLQLLIQSIRSQQSGLSTTGWGRVIPPGGAIVFPQADATWRGVVYLSKMAPAVWGMDSAQGSWQLLCQFSPQIQCPQSVLQCLQSILPSLCQSPG